MHVPRLQREEASSTTDQRRRRRGDDLRRSAFSSDREVHGELRAHLEPVADLQCLPSIGHERRCCR